MSQSYHSFRRLADLVPYLVDGEVGIIRKVTEIPRAPGEPNFFHFSATACDTSAFTREKNFNKTGGASTSRESALAKALGEAVERYCSAYFDFAELPLTSFEDADFRCVSPDSFALHSAEQYESPGFPWLPFTAATPVRWQPMLDLWSGETWHVPAALVYVPYIYYQGTGDSPIVQPISTGLACHCSLPEAALGGICETVERDSFTLTWQAQMAVPQIRVETLSDENYELVQRFEIAGAKVFMLNITTDLGIPCVLSVLKSEVETSPALVFAASASLSPEEAARKSLEELAHTRRYSQQIKELVPPVVIEENHENIETQIDHLNFWCDYKNAPLADFLFSSKVRQDFAELEDLSTGSPRTDLEVLVNRLHEHGYQALTARLTTSDVAGLGLEVVRSVVPGLNPLFMGHRIRSLGGERLWTVPQRMGLKGITRETGDNPWPHPYP
jgi:ribosomal protein S12 methylthiotransferase accessory factor